MRYKVSVGDYKPYIATDINRATDYVMKHLRQCGYNPTSPIWIIPIQ